MELASLIISVSFPGNRTPVNCGDYMNELNGQSSSTHYANMTATSSISVPYADCPATGAQATPSSHYGNTDCTLYDCNRLAITPLVKGLRIYNLFFLEIKEKPIIGQWRYGPPCIVSRVV